MKSSTNAKAASLEILSTLTDLGASGLPEGETEKTELRLQGNIRFDDRGNTFISYREDTENGAILSDVKISDGKVTVLRRGAIESTMVFEEGILHRTVYSLPPYSMDMEIMTKRIRRSTAEGSLSLSLSYEMKIGGSARSAVFKINAIY